eukprot:gene19481-30022_t
MGAESDAPSAPPAEAAPAPPAVAPLVPGEELDEQKLSMAAQPLATEAEVSSPDVIYVQANSCSVAVTELSSNVTKEMLTDFLTFCGEVTSIVIKPDSQQPGKHLAVVSFSDAAAVDD